MQICAKNIDMSGLIALKKEDKRKRLLNAAYDLFVEKGVSDTSIAEICTKAGIAKGTFYLYFSGKEDILRALAKKMSLTIMEICCKNVLNTSRTFIEKLVALADSLIDLFQNDPDMLKVLKKDFIWPISEEDFLTTDIPIMVEIRKEIEEYAKHSSINEHEILVRLYALIAMLCSVCYSCIIDHFPDDIEMMKPELFKMIENAFQS